MRPEFLFFGASTIIVNHSPSLTSGSSTHHVSSLPFKALNRLTWSSNFQFPI